MHHSARYMQMSKSYPYHVPIKHSDYGVARKELMAQLDTIGIPFASWVKRRVKKIEPTFIYGFKTYADTQRFINHLNSLFSS